MKHRDDWTAGSCSWRGCPMTLVRYIGGGQWACWLHWLACGLSKTSNDQETRRRHP